jgi:TP901 family phage tail tape measure protein
MTSAMVGAGAKMQSAATKQMRRTAAAMTSIGSAMSKAITVPVVAAVAASIHMAMDYQASMEKLQSLVGVSKVQVDAWTKTLLKLGPEVGKSPKELADAMFFVTSAGLRGQKALDVLTMSARASAAGLGETKTVADAVTSAVNAYSRTNLKAASVTDTMVAAVREGKMPVEDLAKSIGFVLPIASEAGVSFSELAGTAAALSRVGAPVSRTMTGIRFLLMNMIKPTSAAGAALESIGMSADDLRKSIKD